MNALPVVDERDELIGVIGVRDLLTAPHRAADGIATGDEVSIAEKLDVWEHTPVREVMANKVITVSEDTLIMRVAAIMANTGVHPVPVLRGKRVIGLISRREVIKAILHESDVFYRPVA